MATNTFLIAGGVLSALASLLRIVRIAGGPAWQPPITVRTD